MIPARPALENNLVDPLLKWRAEFPILGRTTYLISNSLGAMPRGVYDSLRDYADSWGERGVRAWEEGSWAQRPGKFPCIRTSRQRKP